MAIDDNGVIYGATNRIVDPVCDSRVCGNIFSLTPPTSPAGPWAEETIYTFTGGDDGTGPQAGVTIGAGGVLYGPALGGAGKGSIFALTPGGGGWRHSTLHSFAGGSDGAEPSGPLVIDNQGVLYGTTSQGGAWNHGTVFSLTPSSSTGGGWTETVLYSFTGGSDGFSPAGLLVGKGAPVLYGTAHCGAPQSGVAYSLTPPSTLGGSWTQTVLHNFPKAYHLSPGALVLGPDNALYGSTFSGGAQHSGSVYVLVPPRGAGESWTFHGVYSFSPGFAVPGGNSPYVGEILAVDPSGLLYGTTYSGGSFNFGTVFSLQP